MADNNRLATNKCLHFDANTGIQTRNSINKVKITPAVSIGDSLPPDWSSENYTPA